MPACPWTRGWPVLAAALLVLQGSRGEGAEGFWPLREGNSWLYRVRVRDRVFWNTRWVVEAREGETVRLRSEHGNPDRETTLRDRGREVDIELPGEGFVLYYRFVEGSSWRHGDLFDCDDGVLFHVTRASEPIATPAGTFPDCLHVQIGEKWCSDAGILEEWWAPGVGLVKRIEDGFVGSWIWELIDYCVEGEACGEPFHRGDANADGGVDIADAVRLLSILFCGTFTCPPLPCPDAADANDDGRLDIADPIAILGHLFVGAGPFPVPFPFCGTDPSADGLQCPTYPACPP